MTDAPQPDAPAWPALLGQKLRHLQAHPDDHPARMAFFQTVARLVRAGTRAAPRPLPRRPAVLPFVSVILCSIDDARCARATAHYHDLLRDWPHEVIALRDAQSLSEAYARGLRQAQGEAVILSHDDVTFLCPDFAQRIVGHLRGADVLGFAGSTNLSGPSWIQSGWRAAQGIVATPGGENGAIRVDVYGVEGALSPEVQAVDGLCLICRRAVIERIGFDAKRFDGFHLYDTDFCWRAYLAGWRLAVVTDVPVLHQSSGRFDATWRVHARRFLDKYPNQGFSGRFGENPLRAVVLDNAAQVRAFWAIMVAMGEAYPEALSGRRLG